MAEELDQSEPRWVAMKQVEDVTRRARNFLVQYQSAIHGRQHLTSGALVELLKVYRVLAHDEQQAAQDLRAAVAGSEHLYASESPLYRIRLMTEVVLDMHRVGGTLAAQAVLDLQSTHPQEVASLAVTVPAKRAKRTPDPAQESPTE